MNVGVQVPWHTCGGQNTTLVLVLTYLAKKKILFFSVLLGTGLADLQASEAILVFPSHLVMGALEVQ